MREWVKVGLSGHGPGLGIMPGVQGYNKRSLFIVHQFFSVSIEV